MHNGWNVIRGILTSQDVCQRLWTSLQSVPVSWDDGVLPEVKDRLERRNIFIAHRGQGALHHRERLVLKPQGTKPPWQDVMPPVKVYWFQGFQEWRLMICDAGLSLDGGIVKSLVDKQVSLLFHFRKREPYYWQESSFPDTLYTPSHYKELPVVGVWPTGWVATQILSYRNERRTTCTHCEQVTVTPLDTEQVLIAFISGVDRHVMQADWLVYQRNLT